MAKENSAIFFPPGSSNSVHLTRRSSSLGKLFTDLPRNTEKQSLSRRGDVSFEYFTCSLSGMTLLVPHRMEGKKENLHFFLPKRYNRSETIESFPGILLPSLNACAVSLGGQTLSAKYSAHFIPITGFVCSLNGFLTLYKILKKEKISFPRRAPSMK